jgi:protein-S-isoprenylcysteine O-methyltransferase Ste14
MEPSQPAAENAPPGHPSAPEILGWVLVLLGAALRIRAWSHWRSLWNDEICIAHSLVTRGLHRLLFEPLDL